MTKNELLKFLKKIKKTDVEMRSFNDDIETKCNELIVKIQNHLEKKDYESASKDIITVSQTTCDYTLIEDLIEEINSNYNVTGKESSNVTRTLRMTLRMTQDEKDRLEKLSEREKMTPNNLIFFYLNNTPRKILELKKQEQENNLWLEITRQIKGCGININQVAKNSNIEKKVTPQMLKAIYNEQKKIWKLLRALQNDVNKRK